ncbi:MAG: hypothetical protein AB8G99_18120 [Planctomycetaceae bacterium]
MMVFALAAIILALPDQPISIYRLTVDTGVNSEAEREYLYSVADEYRIQGDLGPMRHQAYVVDVPKGYQAVTGYAFYIDPKTGEEHRFRYWRVPDQRAAQPIIDKVIGRFGSGRVVNRDGGNIKVTLPNQAGTRRKLDAYLRYENGIIAVSGTASATLHSVSMAKVAEWAELGRGKHTMFALDLKRVSQRKRVEMMAALRKTAFSALQQRDDEPQERYAVRRAVGEMYLGAIDTAADSVDEIVFWTQWPGKKPSEPWRCELRVQLKEDSLLSRYAGQLRIAPQIAVSEESESEFLSLQIAALLPRASRDALGVLTAAVPRLRESDLGQQLTQSLKQGRLEVAASGRVVNGEPVIAGGIHLDGPNAATLQEVLGLIGSDMVAIGSTDEATVNAALPQSSWLPTDTKLRLTLSTKQNNLLGFVAKDTQPDSLNADDYFAFPRSNESGPILRMSANLQPFIQTKDDVPPSEWLIRAEQLFDEYQWNQVNDRLVAGVPLQEGIPKDIAKKIQREMLAKFREGQRLRSTIGDNFQSLANQLKHDGSWTATGRVDVNSKRLKVSATVGRDLHRFYIARKMLARQRIWFPR